MLARSRRKLSIEQFFADYSGAVKYELIDGEAVMMTGGTVRHGEVGGNIYAALHARLRGSGCRPFNSDTGLRIDTTGVLYPYVAIYCDPRDLDADRRDKLTLTRPVIVFEVLSPGTANDDRGYKVLVYKEIATVESIVLIDPERQRIERHDRVGPEKWQHEHLPTGSGLTLRSPVVELTFAEIFAAD